MNDHDILMKHAYVQLYSMHKQNTIVGYYE